MNVINSAATSLNTSISEQFLLLTKVYHADHILCKLDTNSVTQHPAGLKVNDADSMHATNIICA